MKKHDLTFIKKRSALCINAAVLSFICVFIFIASSCKSVEKAIPAVDALSVLEEDSAVYFRIPAAQHSDFVKKLLYSAISGLTEENASLIVPKIDNICAGIGSAKDAGRIQFSADGYIPPLAIKAALTSKNGWNMKKSSVNASVGGIPVPYIYYSREDTDYSLGLASLKNIVLAKDVDPLFTRYNAQLKSVSESGSVMRPQDTWTSDTYEWMSEKTSDIRFCVLRPQAFLASLLGTDMRFAIVCARGALAKGADGSFNLTLELEFPNSLVVKAARAALTLVFGKNIALGDSATVLKLTDMRFTQEQILEIFVHNILP
ncbi:hypothetical protein HRI96_05605 [Treponema parvum]|uniref:Outer membrane-associated lipoprotein TP0453 domain-containing protein n=1 Tax=Treponema parvum TaxID=138851 RepID=A0A975EZD1_9SPIR|nr:hypothetical protein [Treponema parvum]QTQ11720.1 hypothetical protein HRI96_05605 [Treponema parvum]